MKKFEVSVSITDFSLLPLGLEPLFKGMKAAGADGLEIVTGVKSRWSLRQLNRLSEKYSLPVCTLHQPIWSGLGFWLDEGFIRLAKDLQVKGVVIHALFCTDLEGEKSTEYLTKLARWQDKYKVQIFLENSPYSWGMKILDILWPDIGNSTSIKLIGQTAKKYGFLVNYDTSHGAFPKPQEQQDFQQIFPQIGNIHLSSFNNETDHLPLFMGKFDTTGFIRYLYKHNYAGNITFEIYYPKDIQLAQYDFAAIKKSIELVKSV